MANKTNIADHSLTIKKMTGARLSEMELWLRYEGAVVYFVGEPRGSLVKIGFASNLANRLRHLQTGSPVELKVLAAIPGNVDDERAYHQRFAEYRRRGEWFERAPVIRAEITRIQDLGRPDCVQKALATRAAEIRKYWREESKRQRAAQAKRRERSA